jgi:hypothetical protein
MWIALFAITITITIAIAIALSMAAIVVDSTIGGKFRL